MAEREPLFCDRCLCVLRAGRGELYEVRIEAVADPSPPDLAPDDVHDPVPRRTLAELSEEMKDLSAREAMDQVVRCLTICLCNRCYQTWIENPAGG